MSKDKMWEWIAYRLPKRVLYWAVVRATAYVSTRPPHARTVASEITAFDVMEHYAALDEVKR